MTDMLPPIAIAWLAEVVWPATLAALIALAAVRWLRGVAPAAALAVTLVALARFFLPPLGALPTAVIDRTAAALRPAAAPDDRLVMILLAVYLTGVVIMAWQVLLRRRRLAAMAAAGHPIEAHVVETPARALGLRNLPIVRVVDAIDSPLACGVRQPAVLIPRIVYEQLPPRQLSIVIAHELAHHRARDLWLEQMLTWATVIYWWHPLVWRVAATARALREERCDDRVIALGVDAYDYCCTLRDVARQTRPALAMAMAAPSPLSRRVRRLMSPECPPRAARAAALALVIAFACAAWPAAAPAAKGPSDDRRVIVDRDVRVHRIVR